MVRRFFMLSLRARVVIARKPKADEAIPCNPFVIASEAKQSRVTHLSLRAKRSNPVPTLIFSKTNLPSRD